MRQLPLADPGTPPLRGPATYLWWMARRQWGILLTAVACGVVQFACQAFLPYLTGRAIDDGLADGFGPALLQAAGLLLTLGLVSAAASAVGHRYDVANWLRAAFTTSQLVGRTAARSGDAITAELPTGEVVSAVANDALRVGEVYASLARFVGSVVAYAAVAVLMLQVSVQLGLVVLLGLPAVAGVLALLVRPLQRRQTAQREASGRLTTLGADTVSGLRVLRGIGGENVFTGRYREQSQLVRRRGVEVAVTQSWLDALQVLLPGVFVVALVWLGAHMALAGTITPGQLVTTYGYAAFLGWPVQNATQFLQATTRAVVGTRKVLTVLRVVPAAGTAPRDGAVMPPAGSPLVDEASGVTVEAGRVVALVSADPDESARIATRLGRFDDAEESATPVTLGGVPLATLPLAELRRRVVVAEAMPQLFSGPLAEGLDVRGGATRDDLLTAIGLADAQDVLDSVPDGLDGELTEKGRSLSGGQRQRVALARALLTQAEVLVLVEPTSAVDAHTEARIAARLADARRGRATLVVTASPLVLDHVDEVQLVHDGRLVARGTHAELLDGAAGPQVAATYRRVVGRNLDDDLPVEETFEAAEPDARTLTQPTTTPGGAA
ncbi:ABC transporter ATP-binding protein/permease [Cellulomonas iranensis]|uniref:ABC transporter ATP-binding protein n=1 Tax=Cellulomonas iranensis TaxID=76862 RepID=UPI001CF373B1|nr:ABC transporter ATP-binding protein [Cellulomonas iranensis]UCN15714.1 ABC transporter ATP-binding protein/permease [Cellulomonas iranensis]